MPNVCSVAAYMLEQRGDLDALKLQKLCYYAQGWYLAAHGIPLFPEVIKAWRWGPVVPKLYGQHRGKDVVCRNDIRGDASELTDDERWCVDAVLEQYASKEAMALVDQTHAEAPWLRARAGLDPGDSSDREISRDDLREYFGSILGEAAADARSARTGLQRGQSEGWLSFEAVFGGAL